MLNYSSWSLKNKKVSNPFSSIQNPEETLILTSNELEWSGPFLWGRAERFR